MKSHIRLGLALLALPALSGCIARTAAGVVTAPVRAVGKTADWMTTSQSEADEKRGRAMRQREAQLGKLDRQYQRHLRECDEGQRQSCQRARDDYADIQNLRGEPY